MSIQGIRRIREGNGKSNNPELTLRHSPEMRQQKAKAFTPMEVILPARVSFKKSAGNWLIAAMDHQVRNEQQRSPVHRKTGSLGPSHKREREYHDLITNQLYNFF